jgi:hypothetical protein
MLDRVTDTLAVLANGYRQKRTSGNIMIGLQLFKILAMFAKGGDTVYRHVVTFVQRIKLK